MHSYILHIYFKVYNLIFTDFETRILSALSNMQNDITSIKHFLIGKKVVNINSRIDFSSKYNFTIPFKDIPNFQKFNKDLASNDYLKKDVVCTTCILLTSLNLAPLFCILFSLTFDC